METLVSRLRKLATPKNAFIVLALFILNAIILGRVDQPLSNLAGGEPKLDLRFGYDLATVERLFDSYGEQGREWYVWDLLVDTPFPVLGGLATILFVLAAFQNPLWQKVLVIAPIMFIVTDLLENVLFLFLLQSHPFLSSALWLFRVSLPRSNAAPSILFSQNWLLAGVLSSLSRQSA